MRRTERSSPRVAQVRWRRLHTCFHHGVRDIRITPIIITTRITALVGAEDCGLVDFIRAIRFGVATDMGMGTATAVDLDTTAAVSAGITAQT